MRMHARIAVLLVAGLAAWAGCDSDDPNDGGDAELFVGTWEAVAVTVSGIDLLSQLGGEMTVTLTETTYDLELTIGDDPRDGFSFTGQNYTVDEGARTITFPPAGDVTEPVVMQYAFDGPDRVTLQFDGAVLATLGLEFPIDLTGQTITLVVERVDDGA